MATVKSGQGMCLWSHVGAQRIENGEARLSHPYLQLQTEVVHPAGQSVRTEGLLTEAQVCYTTCR